VSRLLPEKRTPEVSCLRVSGHGKQEKDLSMPPQTLASHSPLWKCKPPSQRVLDLDRCGRSHAQTLKRALSSARSHNARPSHPNPTPRPYSGTATSCSGWAVPRSGDRPGLLGERAEMLCTQKTGQPPPDLSPAGARLLKAPK
jgi:hypothetical protein